MKLTLLDLLLVAGVILAGILSYRLLAPEPELLPGDPVTIHPIHKQIDRRMAVRTPHGTHYYLVATDGATCRVSFETYLVMQSQEMYKGMWEEVDE